VGSWEPFAQWNLGSLRANHGFGGGCIHWWDWQAKFHLRRIYQAHVEL
jgi:hypothetical protein